MNIENVLKANNIVSELNNSSSIKRIKNEKGLIEKIELNKVVITEDNKMLLRD
jgi:hypothetical protein